MNKRFIVLFVFALLLVVKASSVYSLTIKQPSNNTVLYPGQKVKVVIEAAPNEDIVGIVVSATSEGSSSEVIINPPYEVELKMGDKYVGNARIETVARLKDDTAVEAGIDIAILLPPDVNLDKIETNNSMSIQIAPQGKPLEKENIQVRGLFSDGIRRDLNILNGVLFTSSNPIVASVDNKGIVTAISLGWTTITIEVGDKKVVVKVHVFLDIELDRELLVKPADTGIQLDWKLSPQDPEWVTGYIVFRTEDPDGIFKKKIADLPNGTTRYLIQQQRGGKPIVMEFRLYLQQQTRDPA